MIIEPSGFWTLVVANITGWVLAGIFIGLYFANRR